MFSFIKSLFGKNTVRYQLGAFESPIDTRNIDLASFQKPVALQNDFDTELNPVENQLGKGDCVGEGIHKLSELRFKQKGIIVNLSARDLYRQCKDRDGIHDSPGTYPVIGAKVACSTGIASVDLVPDDKSLPDSEYLGYVETPEIKANRAKHIAGGYAFVQNNFDAICQAIQQNGAIAASCLADYNWFSGIMMRVFQAIGRHYVVLHGFTYDKQVLKAQNSWGIEWIGYIAGIVNSRVKPGHFELSWADVNDTIMDIIVIADIPPEILKKSKGSKYIFLTEFGIGTQGGEVSQLQQRLIDFKIFTQYDKPTGYFGAYTKACLQEYQRRTGISQTGYFGPITRTHMNTTDDLADPKPASKIDLWCHITERMEGAKPSLNNPGNLKYFGQKTAIGKDSRGFCIFPDYATGYMELRNLFVRACTGQSSNYKPDETIEEFYAGIPAPNRYSKTVPVYGYAPENDGNTPNHYAKVVADYMGVSPTTKIKDLV